MDFTFFCGTESLTRKHLARGAAGGFDGAGSLRRAWTRRRACWCARPGLETQEVAADLFTPAVVPAHPAALALALLMERLQQAAPVRYAAATVMLPASEFGRAAMDELHQQTVNLLSFQSIPRATFDAQVAYNLLCGFGESATGQHERRWTRGFVASTRRWLEDACRRWRCRRSARRCFTVMAFRSLRNWSGRWICRAGRCVERRSCGPGARGYGFAFEPGGDGAE